MKKIIEDVSNIYKRDQFFLSIWSKRVHRCENCGKRLGDEPLTIYFDHLLEKELYKELEFEELNIFLCCGDCHYNRTNGFPGKIHSEAIENAKKIFL